MQALSHTKPWEVLTLPQVWAAPLLHIEKLSFMLRWHGMGGGLGDKPGLDMNQDTYLNIGEWQLWIFQAETKYFPVISLYFFIPFFLICQSRKFWPSFQIKDLEPWGFLYVIMIQTGLSLTKRAVKNKNACWLINTVSIARCWHTSKRCAVCNFSVKDVQGEPFQQVKVDKLLQWKHLQKSWSPRSLHFRCESLSRYISADTTNLKNQV